MVVTHNVSKIFRYMILTVILIIVCYIFTVQANLYCGIDTVHIHYTVFIYIKFALTFHIYRTALDARLDSTETVSMCEARMNFRAYVNLKILNKK